MEKKFAQRFFDAATTGKEKIITELLKKKFPVDYKDEDNRTALMHASSNHHVRVMEILLKAGADPDIQDGSKYERGTTALMKVLINGKRGMVEEALMLLLSHQVKLDTQDAEGRTALMWAIIKESSEEIIDHLVTMGANLDIEDNSGNNALMIAHSSGVEIPRVKKIIKILKNAGADETKLKNINLIRYSATGNISQVTKLLNKGADANHVDVHGSSALVHACEEKHLKVIDKLLENGADPNQKKVTFPPLHQAAYQGNLEVVQMLVAKGADPIAAHRGSNALHYALDGGDDEVTNYLQQFFSEHHDIKNARGIEAIDCNEHTLLVKASIADVSKAFKKIRKAKNICEDIQGKEIESTEECYVVYQFKGHEWTLIEYIYYDFDEGMNAEDAIALSKMLKTKAIYFEMSDSSYSISYHFYEKGKFQEKMVFSLGDEEELEDDLDIGSIEEMIWGKPKEENKSSASEEEDRVRVEFESNIRDLTLDDIDDGFEFANEFLKMQEAYVPGWSEGRRTTYDSGVKMEINQFDHEICPRMDFIAVR